MTPLLWFMDITVYTLWQINVIYYMHALVECTLNSYSCTQFHGGCGTSNNIPNKGVYING